MHADKNHCEALFHLCASDFHLWQMSHFSAISALSSEAGGK